MTDKPKKPHSTFRLPQMTLDQIAELQAKKGLQTMTAVIVYCVNEVWSKMQKKG